MVIVKFVPRSNGESKHAKIQVDPNEAVVSLRDKVAKLFGVSHFRLLFHGRLISEDSPHPITHYKMNPNSTIHVLETITPMNEGPAEKKPPPTDEELEQFIIAFGLAIRNPQFHKVAQRLGQRENLENIAVTCPDLSKDPIARAFLAKPELLYSLLDIETLKYVHERHPSLCEAAYQLVAAVHEEKPSTSKAGPQQDPEVPSAPFAYNLDEMSDEEDDGDDMETGEPNRAHRVGRRLQGAAPITADQLASAIAAAQTALGVPSGMGGMTGLTSHRPPTSAASSTPSHNLTMPSTSSFMSAQHASTSRAGGITQDQLAAALALACGGTFPPPRAGQPEPSPNYDSQLATMREIGITDTQLAIRALSIMSGDVQAAIDLIYSGWKGDDDSAN